MKVIIDFIKSISLPILGAIISTIFGYLYSRDNFSVLSYEFAASVFVGGIVGWLFQIGYEMKRTLDKYNEKLEEVRRSFYYQGNVLRTVLSDTKHDEVINELVKATVDENFYNIPFVNINTYFSYLSMALKQSDSFQGVLDKPISWYQQKSNQSSSYLKSIRDKKNMYIKRRVFFIRNEDIEKMEQDLNNHQVMKFYWENTGYDMASYWITEEDFNENFVGKGIDIPRDSVLFDNKLYIEYSSSNLTLSFKILDLNFENREEKLFNELEKQIRLASPIPFRKIPENIPEEN